MNTKQTWHILVLTIIFSGLVASPLLAEEPLDRAENSEYWSCCWGDLSQGGSGTNRYGGGRGRHYRSYNFQTTETLDGEVVSLDSLPSRRGTFEKTHLTVKTNKETIEVHLAPSWFLAEQDFDLTPQDKITVLGSRIKLDGEEAIVAREIKKGERTLVLRDRDGFPVWRMGRVPTIDK